VPRGHRKPKGLCIYPFNQAIDFQFGLWLTNHQSFFHSVLHAVVMVGLEQDSYSVTEGQPVVLVCTEISGDIQRAVVVTFRTVEGAAQCEIVQYLIA